MQSKHNKPLVPLAKQLRKEMTREERHLWYDFLRFYRVRFPGKRYNISRIFIVQKQNLSLNWTVLNIMRIEASKKMRTALLFWKVMALRSFVFPTTKSAEISVEFVSLSMRS